MRRILRHVVILGSAGAASVAVALSAWILAVIHLPPWLKYYGRYRQANAYIERVESFRKQNGYYPGEETQDIVPRTEFNNPYYFYRGGGESFEMGFSAGFDDVYSYSSSDKKWDFR